MKFHHILKKICQKGLNRLNEKSIHYASLRTNKGKLLAIATNDEFYHAEINVINKVLKKFSKKELQELCFKGGGFVIEVVRINKHKEGFLLSKPCINCQKRIENCPGIIKIFHS